MQAITTATNTKTLDTETTTSQNAPKYVGGRVSMKQMKLWLIQARNTPNPPKKTALGERHGERAAILSLLDVRKYKGRGPKR